MADYTFRLRNTPLGTLLVKFYRVVPYSDEAFQRARVQEFWGATAGSGVPWSLALYQGRIDTNPVLPEAVAELAKQCLDCTCVRIEQTRERA